MRPYARSFVRVRGHYRAVDIPRVILATLTLIPLTLVSGCTVCGDIPSRNFEFDEPLTAELLEQIQAEETPSEMEEVRCERICTQAYRELEGWEVTDTSSCAVTLPETGNAAVEGRITCAGRAIEYYCEGRRPLRDDPAADPSSEDSLGRSLAALAYLEAASVPAFEELARWLGEEGAPPGLVEGCLRAAEDERSHARCLSSLAEAKGADVCATASCAGRTPESSEARAGEPRQGTRSDSRRRCRGACARVRGRTRGVTAPGSGGGPT